MAESLVGRHFDGGAGSDAVDPLLSPTRVAVLLIPVAVAALVIVAMLWPSEAAVRQQANEATFRALGLTQGTEHRLGPEYVDADGDLVADPPSDLAALRDPEVLVFSYVASKDDADVQRRPWVGFLERLAAKTGKATELVVYESTDDQLRALREGKLHVTGLNTGSVPRAVNSCGFVPVCTLGRADGSFGITSQIIVPAGSSIRAVQNVKGHKLMFTETSSNSGFKAPVVVLLKDFGLAPDRDYAWGFSYSHQESIRRVAEGTFQAAAVASDMLARALAATDESQPSIEGKVRIVYSSERFPPAAIGHAHNLAPELAKAIRASFLEPPGGAADLEAEFGPDAAQFVPVSYKDDFAVVRRIDDTLGASHDVP